MYERENYKTLKFTIQDTGIGIKDCDKDKLFKLFGKLPQEKQINQSGIGMGLTICNKILGVLGSQLEVMSEYGKGSKLYFVIDLPCCYKKDELFGSSQPSVEMQNEEDLSMIVSLSSQNLLDIVPAFPSLRLPSDIEASKPERTLQE